MRARVLVPALLALLASASAQAAVQIDINKDTQTMTVAVDGVARHRWPVSSGLPSYETPNGNSRPSAWRRITTPRSGTRRRCRIRSSSPGRATPSTAPTPSSRLGNPASHGCVRLSRANAATLFALVKAEGVCNTTVTLSGSAQVALARNPQRRNNVASRDVAPQPTEPQVPQPTQPQVQMYDGTARPLPPPQQITPPTVDTAGYYDEYGRWVPGGRTYRRSYEAGSHYAEQQPYAQQRQPYPQQNPYQPRYYYQQQQPQPQYQQGYGQQYYGQPRYYRREYDTYGY